MSSEDFVIVWGGSNIGRNNTKEALKFMSEFVTNHKELNIILINSPHRHDLLPKSCVNLEVVKFNRQLVKLMKPHAKVKVVELKLDRNHFTRHGLHLNSEGKYLVSLKVAQALQ